MPVSRKNRLGQRDHGHPGAVVVIHLGPYGILVAVLGGKQEPGACARIVIVGAHRLAALARCQAEESFAFIGAGLALEYHYAVLFFPVDAQETAVSAAEIDRVVDRAKQAAGVPEALLQGLEIIGKRRRLRQVLGVGRNGFERNDCPTEGLVGGIADAAGRLEQDSARQVADCVFPRPDGNPADA